MTTMIWKTTLSLLVAIFSLSSGYAQTEMTLLKDFSYSRPSSEVDLLNASNINAAVADCVINLENCPADIFEPCTDGGATVTWTPPQFSYTCTTTPPGGEGYSFYVEFNLPESQSACWEYNYVQRIGSNNLRLFQSTGTGTETYFITPLQYFNNTGGTEINMDLIVPDGEFDWTLEVLDINDNVKYTATVGDINSSGLQTIILPSTLQNGVYKLKFKFPNWTGSSGTKIEVDRIYYNATNIGEDCLEGVNFVVSSNYSPGDFFTSGTTKVIYTAIYTDSGGSIEKTCEFNVNIGENPDAPTGTANQSFCSIVNPTVAELVATGSNIKWFSTASGGSALDTTIALQNGSIYYASQTEGECESNERFAVTVTIQDAPEAGTNGTLTVCEGTTITDAMLFAELSGADTGGTWSGPVDGVYTYTVAATAPCTTEDTATVTVTIQDAPEAGTNGTLTVCEGTNITDTMLFAELTGADEGGTWSGPVNGVYTYTVAATSPCTTEDTATVTVTIQDAPEAGTSGTLTVCEGTTITDAMLFAELSGADENGTWSGPVDGVYTYTVAATSPCTTEDTATVTVTIQDAPEAGTSGTLTVCEGTTITDAMLFAELTGADTGGTWSGPVDGVYTYTVAATAPCTTEDTATVTVTIQDAPEAGTNGTLTVCEGTNITDAMLFAELSGADENGTWSGPVNGVYTYTVAATAPCTTEDTATVTVTIQDAPEAGTNGTLTVCEGTNITDAMLFAELTGADEGGTWSGPVNGVYTYTVAATAPCTTEDTATVTVTIQDAPEAGTNGTLTVCEGTTITDAMLFAELTGADAGGTWSGPVDGVYTYTVAATAPCTTEDTATVTVTIQDAPEAGTNGTLTVCEGTTITDAMLFAELNRC